MKKITPKAKAKEDRAAASDAHPHHELLCRIQANKITKLDTIILQNLVSKTKGFTTALWVEHYLSMGYARHYEAGGAYSMAAKVVSCSPSNARRSWEKFFRSARLTENKRKAEKKASVEVMRVGI